MPTRGLLSEGQRARFLMLPDMDGRELVRHHTLSEAELTAVSVRRGAANRLGFAIQLCLLRYPGRPLRAGEAVPRPIVEFVASQIGAYPDAFGDYAGGPEGAGRDTTRREHVAEIVRTFGFRAFDAAAYRELSRWLLPIAEGTDQGETLVVALFEEMRRREIVAPALSTVERLAWETRRRAEESVLRKLVADLDEEQLGRLDTLLVVPEGEDETPLNRVRRPPGPASPKNFKEVLEGLTFVRSLGLPGDVGKKVHHNRLSRLAGEGAKTTPQHLRRFDPLRRRATLVAYLSERAAELSDIALEMHDRMIGALMNRAEKMRDEGFRWNYNGLVDAFSLRHLHLLRPELLEPLGADVPERGVQPPPVVERLQVLEDGDPRRFVGREAARVNELDLQRGHEALGDGVVQRRTRPSHRRNDADLF